MSKTPEALLEHGQFPRLATLLLNATPEDHRNIPVHVIVPVVDWLCDNDRLDQATALCRARQASLGDLPPPVKCARLLKQGGQADVAQDLLHLWVSVPADQPTQALAHANALSAAGATDAAADVMGVAADRFPKNPRIALSSGRAHLAAGRLQAAERELARAIGLQPPASSWAYLALRALRDQRISVMGLELSVPLDVVSPRILFNILDGNYERQERRSVAAGVTPNDRVLELGGGLGVVAMTMAKAVPGLRVTTVEANPALADVIRSNAALNGCDVTLVEGIASDGEGEGNFHLSEDFWASTATHTATEGTTQKIRTVDVNALIREIQPTVLIMDIEGGEATLVPRLDLVGIRRIVLEMHPDVVPTQAYSAIMRHLLGAGFDLDRTQAQGEVYVFFRP